MNMLLRMAAKKGGKAAQKIFETDPSNPITIDSADFAISIGKGILNIAKDILL